MNNASDFMKIKVSSFSLIVLLLAFSVLGLGFLYFVGNVQLEEESPLIQFFADSNTYIKTYRGEVDGGSIIRVDGNYLGPLTVLNVFQGSNYLILLFNVFVFAYSVIHICRSLKLNAFHVAILLLTSPLTVSSLLSVNKEIFLFPFLALALNAYLRKSLSSSLLAFCVSLLARWQLGVFYIALLLIIKWRSIISSRARLLFAMLAVVSVVYLVIQPIIQPILLYVQLSIDNYQDGGSGLFERVLQFQNSGLYLLIFPVKAFHLMFGMGFRIDKIFNPVELYNDFFVAGHCAVAFIVFSILVFKRRVTLKSDLLFVSVIFLVFFCVTPIFAPRYLYLVFVLGVLVLLGAPADLRELQIQSRTRPLFRRNGRESLV